MKVVLKIICDNNVFKFKNVIKRLKISFALEDAP
jgi:hypothetical protein